jgi:5-oxoprolinase (ATP-hydrolysing) subunit C
VLTVMTVAGLATVQDGGRPGRMHEGIPPGGALAPELLAAANAHAGNPPGAAAIELIGRLVLHTDVPLGWASEDGPSQAAAGATLELSTSGHRFRVRYLAVRGGLDVPEVLGGRGTLLVAGLGLPPLRRGDRLAVGAGPAAAPGALPTPPAYLDPAAPIAVVPGPDLDRFPAGALGALLAGPWRISPVGDRTGIRLAGQAIAAPPAAARSAPMVRGAIQVPPSGEPIVLGPDHPTTGGYAVLATVTRSHLGALLSRRPGDEVRFVTPSSRCRA